MRIFGHGWYDGMINIAFSFNVPRLNMVVPYHPHLYDHIANTILSIYTHEYIHLVQDVRIDWFEQSIQYWTPPERVDSKEMIKYWSSPHEISTAGSDIALRLISLNQTDEVLDDYNVAFMILDPMTCPLLSTYRVDYSHILDAIWDEARIAFHIYSRTLSSDTLEVLRGKDGSFEQAQLGPTSYCDPTRMGRSTNWRIAGRGAEFDIKDEVW